MFSVIPYVSWSVRNADVILTVSFAFCLISACCVGVAGVRGCTTSNCLDKWTTQTETGRSDAGRKHKSHTETYTEHTPSPTQSLSLIPIQALIHTHIDTHTQMKCSHWRSKSTLLPSFSPFSSPWPPNKHSDIFIVILWTSIFPLSLSGFLLHEPSSLQKQLILFQIHRQLGLLIVKCSSNFSSATMETGWKPCLLYNLVD